MKKKNDRHFCSKVNLTLLKHLDCIKFSIVQQVFKIIFKNVEQRKLRLSGHCNYRK